MVLILLLYGGTLLGSCLGGQSRVLTFHEALFAEPAREMVRTGDWLMPRFAGVPCTHKPPLTHWLIALAMTVFNSRAEWICRLPSVLAALGVALLVAMLATRWYGRRVGLVSGLVQLSAYYVLMQARLAEADMLLCLTVTGAMAAFALGCVDRRAASPPALWLSWLFWACCGLAFMTKFVIGPVFILGGCVGYIVLARDWKAVRFLVSPVGWAIAGVLIFAWPIAVYQQYPEILQDWYRDNIARFMGGMNSGHASKPVMFYVYMAPALMAPWTLWLLPGIWAGIRQRLWKTSQWRFLAGWFGVGLIILTASAWKHKHYAIPILPPLSIIAGWFLVRNAFIKRSFRLPRGPAVALIAAGCAAAGALLWSKFPAISLPIIALMFILAAILTAAVLFNHYHRAALSLACLFAGLWVVSVGTHTFASRHFDSYRVQAQLAERVNAQIAADRPIYVVDLRENQIVFYLRLPLISCDNVGTLSRRMAQDPADSIDVLAPAAVVDQLAELGTLIRIDGCVRVRKGIKQQVITYWRLIREDSMSDGLLDGTIRG